MSFWKKPSKIGIALSGGGARGLAHIGVLEVLENEGIQISAVSGTSMGSVIGGLYCSGIQISEILKFMETNVWKRYVISSAMTIPNLPYLNSLSADRILNRFFSEKTFNDCKKPFCAVAVDIVSRKKVFITHGKLKEAIKASIAIPGIFEPFVKDGLVLVDGGVIEPLPIDAIRGMDVDFIIGVALNNIDRKEIPTAKTSIIGLIDLSLSIMEREIENHHFSKADVILQPKTGNYGLFEFGKALEIIEAGRTETKKKLTEIKKKIN
jgi:NTE family protein